MCQCGFINCNIYTTLLEDVENGGVRVCLGTGVNGRSLYVPLNFAVNLKLLEKNKMLIRIYLKKNTKETTFNILKREKVIFTTVPV